MKGHWILLSLWLPVAHAELAVTLEQVATSLPQESPDTAAVGFAHRAAGSVYYTRTDFAEGAQPNGIYRDGTLILPAGAPISGFNSCCGPAAVATDGTRLLVAASTNYPGSSPNTYRGIFALLDGNAFTRILDRDTPIDGYLSPRPTNQIASPSIDGNAVAFYMTRSQGRPSGIGRYNISAASAGMIVLEGDTVPDNGGVFTEFPFPTTPLARGSKIVFRGVGTQRSGIYEWNGSGLQTVVDTATPLPEGGGNFPSFQGRILAVEGGDYAFGAGGFAEGYADSVYKIVDGTLSLVANPASTALIFPEPLTVVLDVSLRKGKVVFTAIGGVLSYPYEVQGIYTDYSGSLEAVVDLDTDFNGRTPFSYAPVIGSAWETDDSILFSVVFDDQSSAIYRARLGDASGSGQLQYTVEFHGPRKGTITVTSRSGYNYTLRRSSSPGLAGIPLATLPGTGGSLGLDFDDSASPDTRAFFVVEESEAGP